MARTTRIWSLQRIRGGRFLIGRLSEMALTLLVLFLEGRSFRSMGFRRKDALSDYLKGACLGFAMICVTG